jgi:hypothetical protein
MLRHGEEVVKIAGGRCSVCKQAVMAGQAIQLSKWTIRIRHLTCLPKTDSRVKSESRTKRFMVEQI